jgi:hypothetical protein
MPSPELGSRSLVPRTVHRSREQAAGPRRGPQHPGDPGNAALAGSDLGAPDFSDANAVASNVAPNAFTVAQPVLVTLFAGTLAAPGTATFVDSNYAQATIGGLVAPGLAAVAARKWPTRHAG